MPDSIPVQFLLDEYPEDIPAPVIKRTELSI